jgi:hypothetical protein
MQKRFDEFSSNGTCSMLFQVCEDGGEQISIWAITEMLGIVFHTGANRQQDHIK